MKIKTLRGFLDFFNFFNGANHNEQRRYHLKVRKIEFFLKKVLTNQLLMLSLTLFI